MAKSLTRTLLAPEQARGEADGVGPRSDIFALGGVLYFLLTGGPPFDGKSTEELLDRARRCDFDRQALQRKGVSRSLERICLKAMAAEPADRFSNAGDMADALDRHLRRPIYLGAGAAAGLLFLAALLIAMAIRGGGEGFRVEKTALRRHSQEGRERLFEGSPIQVGDKLSMEFQADRTVFVYVLDEDESGFRSCLFPRSELKRRNPLEGGMSHFLPGDRQAWTVKTKGGREYLFLVASITPIEGLEREGLNGGQVEAKAIGTILRGIDGVTEVEIQKIRDGQDRISAVIQELKRSSEGGEASKGFWIRKVTLSNP